MDLILRGITGFFDLVLKPFVYLPPWVGLAVVSALAGIVLLKLFGICSNQRKIKAAKNQIKACLLGFMLYRNDFRVMLGIQGKMLVANVKYLAALVPSLLVLVIICVPLLGQLNVRYGYRPFAIGEAFNFFVHLDENSDLYGISIKTDGGLKVLTPVLRIRETAEVGWKLEALNPGKHKIEISSSGKIYSKEVVVGNHAERVEPLRARNFIYALLYPGESLITRDSKVDSMEVRYPDADVIILGKKVNWLWIFCVVSIGSGLAFKRWLKVEI